ncbi:AMP-binding protein [Amycolatopsis sp. NPDC059027]|uniref:AMP-binding protein n=1 Tax=Amycolatopsis sp. NPDC059027 TaxID=3346709 RepID=UPI00366DD2D8
MQLSPTAHVDTFCRDHLPPADQWPEFPSLPELGYPERLNCASVLLDEPIARYGGDRTCLRTPEEHWTYAELRAAANRIARVLTEDLGVVAGNRVLLRGPNTAWLVAAWLGVLKAGAVAVTTVPLLRAGELRKIRDIGKVGFALCDHRFLDDLQDLGMRVLPYGGDTDDDLTRRCKEKPSEFADVPTAADDVALLAFTSGTTGRPKATLHFHRDVLAIADTFSRHVLCPNADDLFTGTPPLAFTFGLGALVIFPLRAGAASLLLEKATPEQLADHIAEHEATICFTAPTAYKAMLASGATERLRSLRRCVSAGEHLPEAIWKRFHAETGVRIIDGIGATELLHIFISAADDDIRPGATGKPVPGYRAAVLDDAGNPVPDGETGRLAVQGPTGCRYLDDPRQAEYVRDGWNLTGDTYIRDADGYFWYQARSDDMIVSAGYNIAGPEVEEALLAHPDVDECGVVGAPDPDRGRVVCAYVVLGPGRQPDAATMRDLQDFVKQRIAPYKYPRRIRFVKALPRTSTGKLERHRLREDAALPG